MISKIKYLISIFTIIIEDIFYSLTFIKYFEDQDVIFAELRQNAHILDKGLNIVPFEKGHSTAVYKQCKRLIDKIANPKIKKDQAFLWIERVIQNYEQAQQTGNVNECKINQQIYSQEERTSFYQIIKSRTSCRNFTDDKIDDKIWNEIIEIAIDAPSGCCRQPERYYIEENYDKIQELLPNISGATGFSGKVPYLICITADTRPYFIRDRFLPYIDVSLSIQNFLLACTVNNICGTPLNFQHASKNETKNIKKILNIPAYEKIILFIAAGKPEILPLKPARVNIKKIRKL